MNRLTWIMALAAFLVVGLLSATGVLGTFVFGPLAALILGALAGWRSAEPGARSGAVAGAIVGIGSLVGTILGLTVLGYLLGTDPAVVATIRNSEPDPNARIPAVWIPVLSAFAGAMTGFAIGIVNLGLSTVGGIVGSLLGQSNRQRAYPVT